jgi:hypothetical protein
MALAKRLATPIRALPGNKDAPLRTSHCSSTISNVSFSDRQMNARTPNSMRIPPIPSRLIVLALPCLAVAGCVRTYDGTIVPEYTPVLAVAGGVPHIEYRKSDVLAANRFAEFPDPPPPPPAEDSPSPHIRATPRVESRGRLLPLQVEPEKPVTCRTTPGDGGRVRVACT